MGGGGAERLRETERERERRVHGERETDRWGSNREEGQRGRRGTEGGGGAGRGGGQTVRYISHCVSSLRTQKY